MELIAQYDQLAGSYPWFAATLSISALVLVAWFANFIVKRLLVRPLYRVAGLALSSQEGLLEQHGVIRRLSNVVPAMIIAAGIAVIPDMPDSVVTVTRNVCAAFIVLTLALAVAAVLDVVNVLYSQRPDALMRPIKGYLQLAKIALFGVTAILIIAVLIDRSPLILLSGLGAMAAVLMLVFQDTLLSLVASVQISSSDMVRVGDWIEMPALNADGDVIDIALHTVKVQNWDKTITTLPTRRLISDPFKNWRGMEDAGGRRIKRALYIDQNSIHFLTDEERQHLSRFSLLEKYLSAKQEELRGWNDKLGASSREAVNTRRITNIGTFRAYVEHYLRNHPRVHQELTLMVHQLGPTASGLPLQVYCFTNDTRWAVYESIQSDIFDHLLAILPEFGLKVFQSPSGADLREAIPAALPPQDAPKKKKAAAAS